MRPANASSVTLFHLTDAEKAAAIDVAGFVRETGTYKHTGVPLDGVFFSEKYLDSNEDDLGNVVYAIELDDSAVAVYEIIEADVNHRTYSIPEELANSVARRRLTQSEQRAVPVVDRAEDPAIPAES